MHVCKVYACPAFYNLLAAISTNDLGLNSESIISKLVKVYKHFDAKYQLDKPYNSDVINGEFIFEELLQSYNPDNEQ